MDILTLAILELQREQIKINNSNYADLLIDRIKKIQKFFDMQARNKKVLVNRYK